MAINVSQAFHRTSANPVDESLALTKAQMLTVNDNLMPSKYLTVCQDDGKIYLYDKTNEPDVETGKFREFEGGGEITIDSTPTEGSTNAVQSGGTYTALANKVDKVSGKGLSTNDYTTAEKDKLAGINLSNYIPTSQKGVSNGVATLGANGKVPMSQIPNGLDETIFGYRNPVDELFYEDSEFTEPITPAAGIFYYDELSTNFYRWTGTAYVSFTDGSTGLVLGEVTGTAYDGGKGKANRDAITAIKDGQSIDSFGDVETALSNKVDKVSGKGLSTNDYDNTEKTKVTNAQPKTLATAKTIEGASVTTVEGVADAVQTHTDRLVTDANGVHGFKVTTSGGQDKIYYKSGNSWEEIELGSSIQVSELPTASQDNVGSLLQYIGNTTSVAPIYKHGYFYECVEDGGNYSWQNVSLMDVEEIQKVVLPTASADELGKIYQYIGSTTQTYKKGFFYECVGDGSSYEWVAISVQAGGGQTIQYDIMPTASSENENDIIQYVGTTTANYTNGYFYKCVAQGTDPETYAWEAQPVQEGGGGADSRIKSEILEFGVDQSGIELTPYIKVAYSIPAFNSLSWSDIGEIIQKYYDGDLSLADIQEVWSLGDSHTISFSAMSAMPDFDDTHEAQTAEMMIVDFNTYDIEDTETKCLLTLQMKDCFKETGKMDIVRQAGNTWINEPRRTWCRDYVYPAMSNDVKALIKNVTRTTDVVDNVFIPTSMENMNYTVQSYPTFGTLYDYYSTQANRVKKIDGTNGAYFTANQVGSSSVSNTSSYLTVNTTGSYTVSDMNVKHGLAIAFCI